MREALLGCLAHMLRPVIRFCLRRSLSIQDLIEISKIIMVQIASEELTRAGSEPNISRLSVATGLRRREVTRLQKSEENIPKTDRSVLTKVIGQWLQDKRFSNRSGKPKELTISGDSNEFSKLVDIITKDVKPGAVLSELERVGAIEYVQKGDTILGIRLLDTAYVPRKKPEEGFSMLSADAEDLMLAVEENVFKSPKYKNLHATTEFDNIPKKYDTEIKQWMLKEGVTFHNRVRKYLSKFDLDFKDKNDSNDKRQSKIRVVLGTFSRVSKTEKVTVSL